ncbi:MAG: hypothetical protein QXZ59_02935, partial [Nitrososphaeria archaeon]
MIWNEHRVKMNWRFKVNSNLTFISQWNYLLWPLIITSFSPWMTTIPVGLAKVNFTFGGMAYRDQNLVLAGLVLQVIPVVALF